MPKHLDKFVSGRKGQPLYDKAIVTRVGTAVRGREQAPKQLAVDTPAEAALENGKKPKRAKK